MSRFDQGTTRTLTQFLIQRQQTSSFNSQQRANRPRSHGDDHGAGTHPEQHTERVRTGLTPSGVTRTAPPTASRFDSPDAEAEAFRNARTVIRSRGIGTTTRRGNPRKVTVVVGARSGGASYGTGYDGASSVGRLPRAVVVMEWCQGVSDWGAVTAYPTAKPEGVTLG